MCCVLCISQTEYKIRSVDTATKCSAAAKKAGVSKWVEVSTAQVYKPSEKVRVLPTLILIGIYGNLL